MPNVDTNHPLAEQGYALMGAAFEVHKTLGGGLLEEIYQQSLEIELQLREIPFQSQQQLAVFYKGQMLNKRYIPDLMVYGKIVVELKAVREIVPEHEAQLINYMRISRQPVGYLISYGNTNAVDWKRFVLSEFV